MKKDIKDKFSRDLAKDITEEDVWLVNVNGMNISFRKDGMTHSQSSYRKKPVSFFRKLLDAVATSTLIVILFLYLLIIALIVISILSYDFYWSILFALVALVIIMIPVLRSIIKRNKFFSVLKKFEKNHKDVKVYRISNKYSSLFSITGKTDILIKTENAEFEIMFLPTFGSLRHLLISKEGDFAVFVKRVFLGNLGRVLKIKPRIKTENISFETLSKEENIIKVILLNPVPHEFSILEKNKSTNRFVSQFSGPGEKISDYFVDNTSSLFRRIELNM